jgi:Carboxypeptidase regulatory-like domain
VKRRLRIRISAFVYSLQGGAGFAATLALVIAFPGYLSAQTTSAAITGHVVDQSNGVVPNAQIRLVEQQTNVAITTRSNASGDFIFADVAPGTYMIIVTAAGFKELRKLDLVL